MSGRASAHLRFDGTLKSWNDERGFGFIEPTQGGQDIFVHVEDFPAGSARPGPGLPLGFEIEIGRQGKKRAKSIQCVRTVRRTRIVRLEPSAPWTLLRIFVIPGFALTYTLIATQWSVTPVIALGYVGMSAATFLAYALDKSAAIHRRRRISESTLHCFGLFCGWLGAPFGAAVSSAQVAKAGFCLKIPDYSCNEYKLFCRCPYPDHSSGFGVGVGGNR